MDNPLAQHHGDAGTPNPEGLLCQVDAIKNLPVLSEHQAELRELVDDDGTSLEQVADMVERNPPFAANLVRIANSPIYGQRVPVDTIKRAIQVIGFRGVGDMALTLEVVQGFGFPPKLDMQLFWDHAVNVALLAKDLARNNSLDGDKAYLVGLLHDVGLLVLPKYLPAAFAQLMKLSVDGTSVHEICRDYFGCTPLDVTARLMQRWSFSLELWEPVWFLSDPGRGCDPEARRLSLAIHNAHEICESHEHGALPWDRLPELTADQRLHGAREYTFVSGISAAILSCC